jgi:hypothetical protein
MNGIFGAYATERFEPEGLEKYSPGHRPGAKIESGTKPCKGETD